MNALNFIHTIISDINFSHHLSFDHLHQIVLHSHSLIFIWVNNLNFVLWTHSINTQTKTTQAMDEYKVIILGAPGVGKTSLIQRYIHDVFDIQVPQQSLQEEDKIVNIGNRQVKLKICDMAGKKKAMIPRYYTYMYTVLYVAVTGKNIHYSIYN